MNVTIRPAIRLSGNVQLPGDKSISHRFAMLAAIAEGVTRIANFAASQDCHSTIACLRLLGIPITVESDHRVTIYCGCPYGLDGRVNFSACGYQPKSDNARAHRIEGLQDLNHVLQDLDVEYQLLE